MTDKIVENRKLEPAWNSCPKCNSKHIKVERGGIYSKIIKDNEVIKYNIDFPVFIKELSGKVTICMECNYDEQEDAI